MPHFTTKYQWRSYATQAGLSASDISAGLTYFDTTRPGAALDTALERILDNAREYTELPVLAKHYSMPTGSDDTAALASAITDANARGGDVIEFRGGTHTVSSINLSGKSNIRLIGAGRGTTSLVVTSTTGHAVDMTNSSFCEVSDMLIRQSAQRTSGEIFYLDNGAGSCQLNNFSRLRMSSPYRGWNLANCTTTTIEDVQFTDFNAGWAYHSGIHLSGAATSTFIRKLRGGTAAGVSNGLVFIDGSTVDTVMGDDWDILGLAGANMTGLRVASGQWMRFTNISIESASQHAFHASDTCHGITMMNFHLLGLRGANLDGGKAITMQGGEILSCQQEGIKATAFASLTDLTLADILVSDVGIQTDNTYDGIYITGNVNDFTIADCRAGGQTLLSSGNRNKYGCRVDATNDRYLITGNRFRGATAGLLDNGGGATKAVANNI